MFFDTDGLCAAPWTFEGAVKMFCWHRHFNIGHKHEDDWSGSSDFQAWLKAQSKPNICMPLYMFDHGNQTISLKPFDCPWDSGKLGVIYVSKKNVRDLGGKEKALKAVRGFVEECDRYIRGEVYDLVVEDAQGEVVDSCGGYIGDEYARQELGRMLGEYTQKLENCEK